MTTSIQKSRAFLITSIIIGTQLMLFYKPERKD